MEPPPAESSVVMLAARLSDGRERVSNDRAKTGIFVTNGVLIRKRLVSY